MTKLLFLLPLWVAVAAVAQNAAPVQKDIPVNVAPEDAKTATEQAARARTAAGGEAGGQPRVLDSVVAIINGDVLLQSDVEEAQRLESLQLLTPGENTPAAAAQRLVTRTLILQQMKAQQQSPPEITDAQVDTLLGEIRKDLPACLAAHCETEAGWVAFLKTRGLTEEEVKDRWRQRLVILDYLNLRFRSGIRIPKTEVEKYYQQTMLPEFEKKHQKPPTLKILAPRIEELLVQQQVSKQIDDWEQTLRQQGSVQILVPAYGPSSSNQDDDTGSGA